MVPSLKGCDERKVPNRDRREDIEDHDQQEEPTKALDPTISPDVEGQQSDGKDDDNEGEKPTPV